MTTRAEIAGAARASSKYGQVEIPITINGTDDPVIVHIPRWKVRRLILQLQRADHSAKEIKRLRSRR